MSDQFIEIEKILKSWKVSRSVYGQAHYCPVCDAMMCDVWIKASDEYEHYILHEDTCAYSRMADLIQYTHRQTLSRTKKP